MVFTAFRLALNKIGSVENKPANLLVVSFGKVLYRMRPSLCGRQMVGPSSYVADRWWGQAVMWQTEGGAKQSTRRGGPSLTED